MCQWIPEGHIDKNVGTGFFLEMKSKSPPHTLVTMLVFISVIDMVAVMDIVVGKFLIVNVHEGTKFDFPFLELFDKGKRNRI